jgi:hypothetical protein
MLLSNQKSKQNEIGLAKKKKSRVEKRARAHTTSNTTARPERDGPAISCQFPQSQQKTQKKKKKRKKIKDTHTHTHTHTGREANSSLLSWPMNHPSPAVASLSRLG